MCKKEESVSKRKRGHFCNRGDREPTQGTVRDVTSVDNDFI